MVIFSLILLAVSPSIFLLWAAWRIWVRRAAVSAFWRDIERMPPASFSEVVQCVVAGLRLVLGRKQDPE